MSSPASIIQNLITNNTASDGGGLYVWTFYAANMVNNTIVDNIGTLGSGVYADGNNNSALFVNNIIVGKSGQSAVYCDYANSLNPSQFSHNLVFTASGNAYGGNCTDHNGMNGNITTDPLLYNSAPGYYYLTAGSPAIDAGDNAAPSLPQTDLYGESRIIDGNNDAVAGVDIGVAEYNPTRPFAIVSGAPAGIVNTTSVSLSIGGDQVVSYRYSLDGGPYTVDSTPVSTPIVLTGLADGQHTVSVIGINSAQKEQLITYATTVIWAVDATPPTTAATPGGGTYSAPQSVKLACDDGNGSGCAGTYYCLGSGCKPTTPYGGEAITINGSTDLRFYSTDKACNSEAVETAFYVGAPQIAVFPLSWDFGPVPLTIAAGMSFTITNSGTAPLSVSNPLIITGPYSTSFKVATGGAHPCDSLTPTIPQGGSCTVMVTFLTSLGTKSANLHIVSNSLSNPILEVPLTGTGVPPVFLTVNINGSGVVDNIYMYPPFSCDAPSCTSLFAAGTTLLLWATPSSLYTFAGWSGGGCSGTGYCFVTLDADTTLSATFTAIPLVQISGTLTTFLSLQEAYTTASDGCSLKARNETFTANFDLDRNIKVTLEGGLENDFATVNGYSVLHGTLTLRSGSLTLNNLVIR